MNAYQNLIGHEAVHFVITGLVALFFFRRYRDWRLIIFSIFFGVFIDVDHWFDYFAYFGPNVNLNHFFNLSFVEPSGKIYVPLHGWEFVFVFWILGKLAGKKLKIRNLEWAVSLAYLGHLLWDNFSFAHHPLAYSFFYRLLNNFSLKSFNGG